MTMKNIYSAAQRRTGTRSFITTPQVRWPNVAKYMHMYWFYLLTGIVAGMWPMWHYHLPVRIVCGRIKNPSVWRTSWLHAEEHSTHFTPAYVENTSFIWGNIALKSNFAIFYRAYNLWRWMSSQEVCTKPCQKRFDTNHQENSLRGIVVDKMHIASHTDKWCLEICDARKHPDLKKVGLVYNVLMPH